MNKISSFLRFVLTITTLLLSACGGAVATSTPEAQVQKAEPTSVAFIGMVDSIAGDQWVINGQTITVTADAIQDGPFNVGDQVKVEGIVNADGSFTVSRVEVPTPQDMSSLPSFGDDNSNTGAENENVSNENASNENSANENTSNENSSNENITINENSSNENISNENSANENTSNENESIENGSNENESNENIGNENQSNENESNGNNGGNENGNTENGGGESEGNGNGNND